MGLPAGLQPSIWYNTRVLVRTEAGYPQHMMRLEWFKVKTLDPNGEKKRVEVHLSVTSERPTQILVRHMARLG